MVFILMSKVDFKTKNIIGKRFKSEKRIDSSTHNSPKYLCF